MNRVTPTQSTALPQGGAMSSVPSVQKAQDVGVTRYQMIVPSPILSKVTVICAAIFSLGILFAFKDFRNITRDLFAGRSVRFYSSEQANPTMQKIFHVFYPRLLVGSMFRGLIEECRRGNAPRELVVERLRELIKYGCRLSQEDVMEFYSRGYFIPFLKDAGYNLDHLMDVVVSCNFQFLDQLIQKLLQNGVNPRPFMEKALRSGMNNAVVALITAGVKIKPYVEEALQSGDNRALETMIRCHVPLYHYREVGLPSGRPVSQETWQFVDETLNSLLIRVVKDRSHYHWDLVQDIEYLLVQGARKDLRDTDGRTLQEMIVSSDGDISWTGKKLLEALGLDVASRQADLVAKYKRKENIDPPSCDGFHPCVHTLNYL